MSMMNDKVYDVFLSVGATEDKARAAAVALAEYDPKISALDHKLSLLQLELRIYAAIGAGIGAVGFGSILRILLAH